MVTKRNNPKITTVQLKLPALYRGAYARVAKLVPCTPQFVGMVANGKRRSTRVERLLRAEITRIKRESAA